MEMGRERWGSLGWEGLSLLSGAGKMSPSCLENSPPGAFPFSLGS